jgi:hypothetical protein
MATIKATARLRSRNQLTLPDPIVKAGGFDEGAVFVVELDPSDPGLVHLRRVRTSYAGALNGMFEPVNESVAGERTSWDQQ